MEISRLSLCIGLAVLWWSDFVVLLASARYTPFLDQSFFFHWNPQGQPVPVPVTAQCDTINIRWARGPAQGPNPVAPYYMQVYTSTSLVPLILSVGDGLTYNWTVPFPVGTQYQICMFDSNGATGGCQDAYTVTAPRNASTTCANATFPAALDVDGLVTNGPLSHYGWIDQCTDISVTPKHGIPPYTFTIAPALHPPTNITSNTQGSMNWTVSLSWGALFFISVVDSQGKAWSNGPLHSGSGDPSCLSLNAVVSHNNKMASITIGVGVGAGFGGAVLGVIGTILFVRASARRNGSGSSASSGIYAWLLFRGTARTSTEPLSRKPSIFRPASRSTDTGSRHATTTDFGRGHGQKFHIKPFVFTRHEFSQSSHRSDGYRPATSSNGKSSSHQWSQAVSTRPSTAPGRVADSSTTTVSSGGLPGSSQVYVVHHDDSHVPVTQNGAEVVEPPSQYASSTAAEPAIVSPRRPRRPGSSHRKRPPPI